VAFFSVAGGKTTKIFGPSNDCVTHLVVQLHGLHRKIWENHDNDSFGRSSVVSLSLQKQLVMVCSRLIEIKEIASCIEIMQLEMVSLRHYYISLTLTLISLTSEWLCHFVPAFHRSTSAAATWQYSVSSWAGMIWPGCVLVEDQFDMNFACNITSKAKLIVRQSNCKVCCPSFKIKIWMIIHPMLFPWRELCALMGRV